MNEELELFLEDSEDQLQMMEDALVDLQANGPSKESIDTIFRAVHTIKGSAGMFGFDSIVTFTHIGENFLDKIRQGEFEVDEPTIELFLKCKDHMDRLIMAVVEDEELDPQELALGDQLVCTMNNYLQGNYQACEPTTTDESTKNNLLTDISDDINLIQELNDAPLWHISIRLKEDFFTTGMSILSIFSFYKKIGNITKLFPLTNRVPTLDKLAPLKPYIGFELLLQSDAEYDDIYEAFEFMLDDVDIYIFSYEDHIQLKKLLEYRNESDLLQYFIDETFYPYELLESITKGSQTDATISTVQKSATTNLNTQTVDDSTHKEKKKSKTSSTLRVDANKIDILINYMSEMVITHSKILTIVEQIDNSELEESAYQMKELLEYVRDGIMDIRMVPVGDSFNKFRRIVNDTAKKIDKEVEFIISGGDTELDKTVIEKISDPLIHMLRNSIDHGIETPDERIAKGKPPKGSVTLHSYPDSGTIVIEIIDDGRGLNKERIVSKAIENGLITSNARLSDAEIYKLIFAPGFSTAEVVTDISGRGVGMDVVRKNIEDLRGSIEIDSIPDKGSTITIRLPLTLAIIDGFLVKVGKSKYIVPLENIQECRELTQEELDNMHGNEFIHLRDEMLPIMDIGEVLHNEPSSSLRKNIVVVHFGEKAIGLLVDELLGEHQTVIKSLGDVFANVPAISGGSILGSGEIALIFDIAQLIAYKKRILL